MLAQVGERPLRFLVTGCLLLQLVASDRGHESEQRRQTNGHIAVDSKDDQLALRILGKGQLHKEARPELEAGDTVLVMSPFTGNSNPPVSMAAGLRGVVTEMKDSDAEVDFEAAVGMQLVRSWNLKHLQKQAVVAGVSLKVRRYAAVFEGVESWKSLREAKPGEVLIASGPPTTVQGYSMIPITPRGAVERNSVIVIHDARVSSSRKAAPAQHNVTAIAKQVEHHRGDEAVNDTGLINPSRTEEEQLHSLQAQEKSLEGGISMMSSALEDPRGFLLQLPGMDKFMAGLKVAVHLSPEQGYCLQRGEFKGFGCAFDSVNPQICKCKGYFEMCRVESDAKKVIASYTNGNLREAFAMAKSLLIGECYTPIWVTVVMWCCVGIFVLAMGIVVRAVLNKKRTNSD